MSKELILPLFAVLALSWIVNTTEAQAPTAAPAPTKAPPPIPPELLDSPVVTGQAGKAVFQDEAVKVGPEYLVVMASFPEELAAVEAVLVPDKTKLASTRIKGMEFKAAEVGGRRYLFFLTGMSLVNAAMNTQFVLDHFNVRSVFFTGIAGGVDPALSPGDVVIPANWHYHSEAMYLNETAPGQFTLPGFFVQKYKNFGMIFPDDVTVLREGMPGWEQLPSFPADAALLASAKKTTDAMAPMKAEERVCKVTCGGDGVSGTVFCDNAEYRKWVFDVWKAECLDMESAAIAQVCWENKKPCLIVRGLSDLAGGQTGTNQMTQHLKAAADNSAAVLVKILQGLDQPATTATPAPAAH